MFVIKTKFSPNTKVFVIDKETKEPVEVTILQIITISDEKGTGIAYLVDADNKEYRESELFATKKDWVIFKGFIPVITRTRKIKE